MTIEKLKELVGADAVEKLVRDAATNAAREGDWEKLEEIVQFAKENELNIKPTTTSNSISNSTKIISGGETERKAREEQQMLLETWAKQAQNDRVKRIG